MIRFDCHAHVYETLAAVDGARYVPARPAPLRDWLTQLEHRGISGGVIVQVSFLGADNSQLCAALSQLDPARFAGVGVLPLDAGDAAFDRLAACGIRGIRWNLVRGAEIPDLGAPATRAFLHRLRARGMHLEMHLEGPRLAPLLPALTDLGIDVVIDHFGLPSDPTPKDDPMLRAVRQLQDRQALFFKFSAHYRVPFDVAPHARDLLEMLDADHVVWGSDWPHTQHETRTDYARVWAHAPHLGALSDHRAAQRLYGIEAAQLKADRAGADPR
jgi:predicted TIM-barrel fold metal-dependent hydrolase